MQGKISLRFFMFCFALAHWYFFEQEINYSPDIIPMGLNAKIYL